MVLMGGLKPAIQGKTYRARLRGGPDDGSDVAIAALPGGGPPDFFHAGPDDSGMYVLAGLPDPDGSMPYWWMPEHGGTADVDAEAEATWTLISLGDDGETKLWHQHGEDSPPVRLAVEPVKASRLPTHIGRAYTCPVCHDTAVLSRPPGAPAQSRRPAGSTRSGHFN
jgi:hypothetical protein